MTMTSWKPICSVRISNRLGDEDARMISYLLLRVLAMAFMLGGVLGTVDGGWSKRELSSRMRASFI